MKTGIDKNQTIIKNSLGKAFTAPAVFGGYLFLALGVIAALTGSLIGLGIALLGAFIVFTSNGVIIDVSNKKIKTYTSYFGIKTGAWKALSDFPFVCIFKSNKSYTALSRANVAMTDKITSYDVFLLTEKHREKYLIKNVPTEESAIQYAKQIASILGIELVKYNPVVLSRKDRR